MLPEDNSAGTFEEEDKTTCCDTLDIKLRSLRGAKPGGRITKIGLSL